jgi:hypothetical protein
MLKKGPDFCGFFLANFVDRTGDREYPEGSFFPGAFIRILVFIDLILSFPIRIAAHE